MLINTLEGALEIEDASTEKPSNVRCLTGRMRVLEARNLGGSRSFDTGGCLGVGLYLGRCLGKYYL